MKKNVKMYSPEWARAQTGRTSFYTNKALKLEARIAMYVLSGYGTHPLVKWRSRALRAGVQVIRDNSIRAIKKAMRKAGKRVS